MSETTAEYQINTKNPKTNNNTRNRFARHGLEILKLAVMEVLYQKKEHLLQPKDIRNSLDLPPTKYTAGNTNSLILGVLSYLKDAGYADHIVSYGWQITEKGMLVIEGGDKN